MTSLFGKKILVAEDLEDNRAVIVYILREFGAEVDEVEDGISALQKIQSEIYDAVLLDIRMPGMDGYQVMTNLEEMEKIPPIISLSAEKSGDNSTFACQLTKPIDPQILVQTLEQHIKSGLNS